MFDGVVAAGGVGEGGVGVAVSRLAKGPTPSVGALVDAAVGVPQVGGFRRQRFGGQVLIQRGADPPLGDLFWCGAQETDQQPVHLHARVPVEAAVERRMNVPGPRPIFRTANMPRWPGRCWPPSTNQ